MNFASTRVRVALTAISSVLAIAGCGGGSGGSSGGPPPASSPAATQTPVSHGTPTPTPQSTTTPHSTPTASPTSLATPTASPTSVATPTSTPLSCPGGPSPTPAPPGQVVVTPACVVLNDGNNVAVTVSGGNGNYALTNDTCDGGIIASITQSANPDVYDVLSDGFAIGSCQASFTDGSTSARLTVMNNYVSH